MTTSPAATRAVRGTLAPRATQGRRPGRLGRRLGQRLGQRLGHVVGHRLDRRPEWSVLLLAVFGAVGFAALAWGDGPADPSRTGGGAAVGAAGVTGDGHAGHSLATGAAGAPDWAAATAFGTGLAMWLLMVVAMMLPTTVPLVRYVATATRRSRRQRSILLFAAGHVAAWAPAALLVGVWAMVVPHGQVPRWLAAAALATAGGWELTRWKRRALRRCHRTRPVRFCGRAADVSAARLGLANGRTCVLACGPAMGALVLLGHTPVATLVVSALMAGQLVYRRGEQLRAYTAAAGLLGACAVLAG